MKNRFYINTILILLFLPFLVKGQTVYTKSDTIQLQQDSVILKIADYRGQLQWQYSKDSEVWEDIEGAVQDSLYLMDIDSSGFYRVKVVEGTCIPVYSDSTYVLRRLSEEEEQEMIAETDSINDNVAYYAPDETSTNITLIDTTGPNDVYNIETTVELDSIQPGWLLVDTTGLGQIIFVTDYKEEKRGGVIKKLIEGVQVGIDFLITDDTLSYSSPTNRTKDWWDNSLKLDNEGKVKKFDYEAYLEDMEESVEKEYLTLDFSGKELWNEEGDGGHINVTVEEGTLTYNPAIDFYSVYNPGAVATATLGAVISLPSVLAKSDYIKKGILDELRLITYNDFDLKIRLNIDAAFEKDLSDLIKPKKIAHFWYTIPAGPVLVSVKTELIARFNFEASGNLNIKPEFEVNKNLVLGVNTVEENEEFETNFLFDQKTEKSFTTTYEGDFNFHERFEIVPSVEIYVMGLIGANGEIIPYQEFDFNASISDSHPLIFDCSVDVGVDGHASFDISAFHFDALTAEILKGDWSITKKLNLYHAASKLIKIGGENLSGPANTKLSRQLVTQVLDSKENPIKNFPVFYEVVSGGGNLDEPYIVTDSNGYARNLWTLGSEGEQKVIAKITKADITEIIDEVEFTATIENVGKSTVITLDASDVTETSATLNGNVISDGGETITERGFYWSSTITNPGPENGGNKEIVEGTTGMYNTMLSGLQSGQKYYYTAYAINSEGTGTGSPIQFTAGETSTGGLVAYYPFNGNANDESGNGHDATVYGAIPTTDRFGSPNSAYQFDGIDDYINTFSAYDLPNRTISFWAKPNVITGTGFNSCGAIWQDDNSYYYGVILADFRDGVLQLNAGGISSYVDSTISANAWVHVVLVREVDSTKYYINGTLAGVGVAGNFTSLTYPYDNLVIGTDRTRSRRFFDGVIDDIRIYDYVLQGSEISNIYQENGWTGESQSETGTFTDSRDGNTYDWVKIGDQIWMAENLAYLPQIDDKNDISITIPKYLVYDYNGTSVSEAKATTNYVTHGVLYNWESAKISCPSGWHLPSDDEFKTLESFLGMNSSELNVYDDYRNSGNVGVKLKSQADWNGDNTSRYNGLPSGGTSSQTFFNIGTMGLYWTNTNYNITQAWTRQLESGQTGIRRMWNTKSHGRSVRCIKD